VSGPRPPILERAYQIADRGDVGSTKTIREVLISEGYPRSQIAGALDGLAIRRSLSARMAKARSTGGE